MSANLLNGLNDAQRRAVTSTAPDVRLCECGCGMPVKRWRYNDRHQGRVKGEYARFVHGHNARTEKYQGPVFLDESDGYMKYIDKDGKKHYYHRIVMERIIRRKLRPEEVVHHINQVKSDNRPGNLMLFPNDAEHKRYHFLIERSRFPRNYKPCSRCKQLKHYSQFSKCRNNPDGLEYQCKECKNKYYRTVTKVKRESGVKNADAS